MNPEHSTRTTSRSRRRVIGLVGIILITIVIAGALIVNRSRASFEETYVAYAALVGEYTNAAYLPAAGNNPVRDRVNRLLVEVLAKDFAQADRLASAKEGLQRLEEIEAQIDVMGSTGEQVTAAIDAMEKSAHAVGNIPARGKMSSIVELARTQVSIVSDIRGLSYRANFETAEIFQRVIDDGGVLADSFIIELNNKLPEIEKDFDARTNLYSELTSIGERIQQTHAEL